MNVTDYDRYEMCMSYARTMMMMALILKAKYGLEDDGVKPYIKQGIESCKMAIDCKNKWDEDSTDVFQTAA